MTEILRFSEHINKTKENDNEKLNELRISTKQMNIVAMGRYIRRLSEKIKHETETNKKIDLIAELIIYSLQLLDVENNQIFNKCNKESNNEER